MPYNILYIHIHKYIYLGLFVRKCTIILYTYIYTRTYTHQREYMHVYSHHTPAASGPVLGMVGPVSVYNDWVRDCLLVT